MNKKIIYSGVAGLLLIVFSMTISFLIQSRHPEEGQAEMAMEFGNTPGLEVTTDYPYGSELAGKKPQMSSGLLEEAQDETIGGITNAEMEPMADNMIEFEEEIIPQESEEVVVEDQQPLFDMELSSQEGLDVETPVGGVEISPDFVGVELPGGAQIGIGADSYEEEPVQEVLEQEDSIGAPISEEGVGTFVYSPTGQVEGIDENDEGEYEEIEDFEFEEPVVGSSRYSASCGCAG